MRISPTWLLVALALVAPIPALAEGSSSPINPAQFFDICDSPDVAAASSKASGFGWSAIGGADLDEWRTRFEDFNQMRVSVAAWRVGEGVEEQRVSFWTAQGENGHRACTYNGETDVGLRAAMIERYGALEETTPGVLFWAFGRTQAAYSQSGKAIYINIGVYDR